MFDNIFKNQLLAALLVTLNISLWTTGIAQADIIVHEINFPSIPAEQFGTFNSNFDQAGFVINAKEGFTFRSISTIFRNGNSSLVDLEIFQGRPEQATGTNNLMSLGQTNAFVEAGIAETSTVEFEFTTPIEFLPSQEYFIGFKNLTGVGVNFTLGSQDEWLYTSLHNAENEFKQPHLTRYAPILQFSDSTITGATAVPELSSIHLVLFVLFVMLIGSTSRRRTVVIEKR